MGYLLPEDSKYKKAVSAGVSIDRIDQIVGGSVNKYQRYGTYILKSL